MLQLPQNADTGQFFAFVADLQPSQQLQFLAHHSDRSYGKGQKCFICLQEALDLLQV